MKSKPNGCLHRTLIGALAATGLLGRAGAASLRKRAEAEPERPVTDLAVEMGLMKRDEADRALTWIGGTTELCERTRIAKARVASMASIADLIAAKG